MCLAEVWEGDSGAITRRATVQAGAERPGASQAGGLAFPGVAAGAERPDPARSRGAHGLRLTWFGTNGWKIEFRANDTDRTIHPGAKEMCNYKDDNCNGRVDEGVRASCGVGWCRREAASCSAIGTGPSSRTHHRPSRVNPNCTTLTTGGAASI